MFSSLPPDNFGIHVRTELDERRLLLAVNQIGEAKLRSTAGKKDKRFPERTISVREVFRRFHLRVPRSFYPKSYIPSYKVYILVLRDHSALKIGFSGTWPSRVYAFVRTQELNADGVRALFDENMSVAFDVESSADARSIEKTLKARYSRNQSPSPHDRGLIPFGAGGHKEWLDYSIYSQLYRDLSGGKESVTLASSLLSEPIYVPWYEKR
jgi:hypothetical protein